VEELIGNYQMRRLRAFFFNVMVFGQWDKHLGWLINQKEPLVRSSIDFTFPWQYDSDKQNQRKRELWYEKER